MPEEKQSLNEFTQQVLLKFYEEHSIWSRHQESQRSSTSNLILTLSSLLVGLISFDQVITKDDLIPALFIFILGLFGAIFSYKYYIQFSFHDNRVNSYKKNIETLLSKENANIFSLEKKADLESIKRFRLFKKIRTYQLWITLHVLISIIGLLLVFISLR